MKIDDRVSNYMSILLDDPNKKTAKTPENQGPAVIPGATADSVSISSDATQLAEDEARRERLNAIRKQLSEGTYNISGIDVADKMLNILTN